MALVSPGVQVTVIDQSQYLPTASSSVPLLLIATAQNKINAAGTGVAPGTTAANANKLYQVTSQRDLINLFGNPFFYKTTNGTSIQGYELNEYGLQAAYSLMSATNRAYVLRADIDLGELVGTLSRPTGEPVDGTHWLDTTSSAWGIYEFNATTGKFVNKDPIVLTDAAQIVNDVPKATIGNIGDYAVIPVNYGNNSIGEHNYFYKTVTGDWVGLGTEEWRNSIPTITGTVSNVGTLTAGSQFQLYKLTVGATTIEVPAAPNNTIDGVIQVINDLDIVGLSADKLGTNGPLIINSYDAVFPNNYVRVDATGLNAAATLAALGLAAGTYYQPEVVYGPSAQMPLWTASQSQPHPSKSVWIKTSLAGSGMDLVLSEYSSVTASWAGVNTTPYATQLVAVADLDSAGGKNITEGTVFCQYSTLTGASNVPLALWKRTAAGATVATGSITTGFAIPSGEGLTVRVSEPGSTALVDYMVTTTGVSSSDFVTDWINANINYTSITITTDGSIQISHTEGGEIYLSDLDSTGQSSGIIEAIGFEAIAATNVVSTEAVSYYNPTAAQTSTTSVAGGGFVWGITSIAGVYSIDGGVSSGIPGTHDYEINDLITIAGTELGGSSPANDLVLVVTAVDSGTDRITGIRYVSGTGRVNYYTQISGWSELDFIANEGAPATLPANGRKWFYSTATQADIMVQKGGEWIGYKNTSYDATGFPSATGSNATDPLGPIMATDAPTTQTDGTSLVYGDLWIDTNDLENYPNISRWEQVDGVDQWVLVDITDQISNNGILFEDARWSSSGSINPIDDPIPTIVSLLSSNYVDLDCPDPTLYPQGMLLWNTRRSGYNVKEFKTNYFTSANYPNAGSYSSGDPTDISNLPQVSYTWVSASGLKTNGSPYMGRKAQRNLVVQSMKAALTTNQTIREEDNFFNLIACPNYPELQPDMVVLNNDRNNTAYIVGDTPLRLADQATAIANWATNAAGATATGEDGWVTRDSYLGVFYPSGITTDYTGAEIVVPASHMMLRTFLRNDTVAYPWFAAAGTRRGTIDNATNIGYIDAASGEFVTVKNRMSIRDVLYINQINPLAYFTGVGLLNYGNKNSFDSVSALDRTNVARLIAYIRERVQIGARSFVFEPNDALTRSQLSGVIESLFIDLVAKRGLYDYLVVCDETNNTPARIDRNELWVDIAIEPVKAAEFIYIPVRIMNTGEIAGGA